MRILFVGNVDFSRAALLKLLALSQTVVGIITKDQSTVNADHTDLSDIAHNAAIPFKYVKDINHINNIAWMKSLLPDVIFCFGWSSLLKREVLNLAPLGVIGYHPSLLPFNRGRHPIIWALVLGLPNTGSTFFFMNEGADTGDILSQEEVIIDYDDDAKSLYDKLIQTALKQLEHFLPQLHSGMYKRIPQNLNKGNTWRKRGVADGMIDWRMHSENIYNLVRALAMPYPGAHTFYNGAEIKIWKVRPCEITSNNIEPGKVLEIKGDHLLIKTGDQACWLLQHGFQTLPITGEYLL